MVRPMGGSDSHGLGGTERGGRNTGWWHPRGWEWEQREPYPQTYLPDHVCGFAILLLHVIKVII